MQMVSAISFPSRTTTTMWLRFRLRSRRTPAGREWDRSRISRRSRKSLLTSEVQLESRKIGIKQARQTNLVGRALPFLTRVSRKSLHPHCLDVDEFANAVDAQLAPVTRMLDAAERQARIARHHSVDEYTACFDPVDEL